MDSVTDSIDFFYINGSLLVHEPYPAIFQQFTLTGDIASITFRRHVFTDSLNCLTSDNLSAYRRLDSDIELLAGDQLFQFLAHTTSESNAIIHVRQCRQSVYRLTVQQDI